MYIFHLLNETLKSMDKLGLNNQIVKMRKVVTKARALTIRQRIRKLKRTKGLKLENKDTICERILQEIKSLKKLNVDDISKYALCNDVSLEACQKLTSNFLLPLHIRCIAKVLSHKTMQNCVNDYKSKYPNWKCDVPLILSVLGALRKRKNKKSLLLKSHKVVTDRLITSINSGKKAQAAFACSKDLQMAAEESDHRTLGNSVSSEDGSGGVVKANCESMECDIQNTDAVDMELASVEEQIPCLEEHLSSTDDSKAGKSSFPPISENSMTNVKKIETNSLKIINSSIKSVKQRPKKLETSKDYNLSSIVQCVSQPPEHKSDILNACDNSKDESALQSVLFSSLVRDNLKQMKLHLIPSQLEKREGSVEIKCLDLNLMNGDSIYVSSNQKSNEKDEGKAFIDPSDDFFAAPEDCVNVLSSKKILGDRPVGEYNNGSRPNNRGLQTHNRHLSQSLKGKNSARYSSRTQTSSIAQEEKVVMNRKVRRALAGSGYDAESFDKQDDHTKRKLISEILPNKRNKKETKVNVLIPETLHPSWAAKRKLKDFQFQIDTFKGKKITFDD